MYKVEIYQEDGSNRKTLLDLKNKISNVFSASLDKQEDNIDSLSLDVMHQFIKDNNYQLKPYKTLVDVRDTKKNKIIFKGRVLAPDSQMSESGAFSHNLVFEGAEAFLQDTVQKYSFEFDKMPVDNLRLVINHHNSELPNEPYKHFQIGTVNVEKNVIPNDGGYHEEEKYFKRWEDKTTYQTLHDDLKGKYGGTFIFEVTDGPTIIHWLKETGNKKSTVIEIAKNLKSIQYKVDPTEIITRLKPLGATSETANGDELRLTIADANGGSPYIDIPELIAVYGVQTGTVDFDAYAPITLKEQAQKWITEQYQKLAKISITLNALDLSLIGIDSDDFDLFNIHRVKCPPLKIDEDLKIVGISINLITPHDKSITIGEKQLTIAELQLQESIKIINNTVPGIVTDQVTPIINETVETIRQEIDTAQSDAVKSADDLARQRVEQFKRDSFEPFKLSIPDIMNTKLSDFKKGELGTIINNTITTNGQSITNDVVSKINSSTNVIRGDAIVVDAAMINKIAADQTFTDKLVATDAFIRNIMASYIVSEKIKATDIDLNRARVYGTVDGSNYITITNDYIKQNGTYTTFDSIGNLNDVKGYTLLQNGLLRIRNDNQNRSLYFYEQGITTNLSDPSSATGSIFFHDKTYGSSGMAIYSENGGINITSSFNKVVMESGVSIELSSPIVKAEIFTGKLATDTTNVFAMTKNALLVTDMNGWNNGSPAYMKVVCRELQQTSHEKYKEEINEWNDEVLDSYRDLQLFSYRFKKNNEEDTSGDYINHGIIIREDVSQDKFPEQWRDGDSFKQNEVSFWNAKAIKELINKVDKLEARINGTTTT